MTDPVTEELLNAYVDGELSPGDDARVAQAIARDPALAVHVATLSRVKSALSGLAVEPTESIHLPSHRWSKAMLAVAASVGLFVAVMSGVLTGFLHFGSDRSNWYQEAASAHAEWASEPSAPDAREVDANLYLVSMDRLNLPAQAPDLTSAKLRLTYLKFYEADADYPAALHLGYTGRRGCRLTLWATAAPHTLHTRLAEFREGKMRSFRWRQDRIAYALFATGMEENRFTMIAAKVHEATRKMRGFDDETRMALREVSGKAPPCAA
ncbi:MAG: zf-HC2 domain-containing protein [Alphaproteobacteria bacterium]|nr:zf-HC2 domain-containing protein [Alphaproteobacteria bacterium]MCK5621421.1 zf-HC2 domain-containing protein [Alphaproteobacteria bacterium]